METSHKKRIATAVVLGLLLVAAISLGGPFLLAGALLFSCLAQWEYYAMFWPGSRNLRLRLTGLAAGAALIAASSLGSVSLLCLVLAAAFWTSNLRFLVHFSERGGAPEAEQDEDRERVDYHKSLVFLSGILYIPLILQFLLLFSPLETGLVILATAASDTGAYYTGSLWGRHKIWPVISPKKSWEGSIGGLAACMALVTVYGAFFGHAPIWVWPLLGALLNVAAQFGDFFESALKRSLHVKDSGAMLPGHGGMLDRIDSLLLAIPVYALMREVVPFFAQP